MRNYTKIKYKAAGRVVKEELKMTKAKVRYVKGVQEHWEEEEEEESPSYPAVKTVYRKLYISPIRVLIQYTFMEAFCKVELGCFLNCCNKHINENIYEYTNI